MKATVLFLALAAVLPMLPPGVLADEATPSVSLERYMGRWYETARFPMWFQRGCSQSWATYTLAGPDTVTVLNECVTDEGKKKSARGTAKVVDKASGSKLEVVFDNWVSRLLPFLTRGKYWIFHIDPDYQHAIVGHPNRKYLWILSRSPDVDDETYGRLVDLARELGFDTARLLRSRPMDGQPASPAAPR
ncbi:MAG: lipocalin family protein [Syntrophobacteraceae bacterium]|jgi:apolipoprotein D and lipocalin family protein|nr:lipocalin family protein [Syntrophobacteraceae bacterium]